MFYKKIEKKDNRKKIVEFIVTYFFCEIYLQLLIENCFLAF